MSEAKLTRELTSSLNPNYPSNSETNIGERERLAPIVKGHVTRRKKGWMSKVRESICGDEQYPVSDYIIFDILIPAVKSMMYDTVSGGLKMFLFGENNHRRNDNIRRDGSRSYVSYTNYYNGNDNIPNPRRNVAQDRYNFEEIIFSSRGEAEEVLSRLVETIEEYGMVCVADFYDLCGVASNFTDNKYGWNSLREAHTDRVRDGYVIRLPRPKPLS